MHTFVGFTFAPLLIRNSRLLVSPFTSTTKTKKISKKKKTLTVDKLGIDNEKKTLQYH
jgi:hypothetical protein